MQALMANIQVYRQQGKLAWGYVIPHVFRVTVTGADARVWDCQDDTHAGVADARTGTLLPPGTGSPRTPMVATLAMGTDARWRLTSLLQVSQPCTLGTS
jgi:hypothetical protein